MFILFLCAAERVYPELVAPELSVVPQGVVVEGSSAVFECRVNTSVLKVAGFSKWKMSFVLNESETLEVPWPWASPPGEGGSEGVGGVKNVSSRLLGGGVGLESSSEGRLYRLRVVGVGAIGRVKCRCVVTARRAGSNSSVSLSSNKRQLKVIPISRKSQDFDVLFLL